MLSWLRKPAGPPPAALAAASPAGMRVVVLRNGAELLAPHEPLLSELRRQVGVPAAHWASLYRGLLEAFAVFVQAVPDLEGTPLLVRRLRFVSRALGLRRDRVLCGGTGAEDYAEKQDVWTYAVVTAALFHDLGPQVLAHRVELVDARGRPLGEWEPWAGPPPLSIAARGRVQSRSGPLHRLLSLFPLMVAQSIVPSPGLRWLCGDTAVLEPWLAVMSGRTELSGELGRILAAAGEPTARHAPTALPDVRALADRLVAGLRDPRRAAAAPVGSSFARDANPQADADAWPPVSMVVPSMTAAHRTARPGASDADPAARTAPDPMTSTPFLAWLREGLATGRLVTHGMEAVVHCVPEGLLLVAPAIFREFAGMDGWEAAQKAFLRLKLHRRSDTGMHLQSYRLVTEDGSTLRIHGYVLPSPPGILGLAVGRAHARISRVDEGARAGSGAMPAAPPP